MSLTYRYKLRKVAQELARNMRNNPTLAEKKFWNLVKTKKVYNIKFLRQHPIYHDYLGKETFYIPDFYSAKLKLIIEIDGPIHNFNLGLDNERTNVLNHLGFKVIRFTNDEVLDNINNVKLKLQKVVKEIRGCTSQEDLV